MFKTRKRKAPLPKKRPVASSSSSDENNEPTVVRNEKRNRKNPNIQKTEGRRKFKMANSSDEEAGQDLKFESQVKVTQESTKSSKPVPDFHGLFSNKDRYETRNDEDFESQMRRYGKNGFTENQWDNMDKFIGREGVRPATKPQEVDAGKHPQHRLFADPKNSTSFSLQKKPGPKNSQGHALAHDDNIDPETGLRRKGYEDVYELEGNKQIKGDASYTGRIKEGELLYKGGKRYTDWNPMQKKDPGTKLIRAVRGPVRAPTFVRVTTRWDYEKVYCRDWKECGFCVFGDCCKYIHDRTDLKHGWELEDKYQELIGATVSDEDYEVSSANETDDEDLPFKCYICRKSFDEPIETLCKHYFCLSCAMKHYQKTQKCFICNTNTKGVFNPAKRIMAKLDRHANDGIDMDDKDKAFDSNSEEEERKDERNLDEDNTHHAFITEGGDKNITQEEEIENEIEIEEALMQQFGEEREDDSDHEDKEDVKQLEENPLGDTTSTAPLAKMLEFQAKREMMEKAEAAVETVPDKERKAPTGDIIPGGLSRVPGFNPTDYSMRAQISDNIHYKAAAGTHTPMLSEKELLAREQANKEDAEIEARIAKMRRTNKKLAKFSTSKIKEILNDAKKREQNEKFNKNLGAFLPKNLIGGDSAFGHQTTEVYAFLKRTRAATEHENVGEYHKKTTVKEDVKFSHLGRR